MIPTFPTRVIVGAVTFVVVVAAVLSPPFLAMVGAIFTSIFG